MCFDASGDEESVLDSAGLSEGESGAKQGDEGCRRRSGCLSVNDD